MFACANSGLTSDAARKILGQRHSDTTDNVRQKNHVEILDYVFCQRSVYGGQCSTGLRLLEIVPFTDCGSYTQIT